MPGPCPIDKGICDGNQLKAALQNGVRDFEISFCLPTAGGCRLGDVDAETSLYSLAIPLGHAPITGMGLVLNGGIGVAGKVFGPASDHIDEVTVVTAEGDVVRLLSDVSQNRQFPLDGFG